MAAASESAGTSRKAAVSFTGGKDSMLVLHLMQAPEVALQTTFNNDAWGADVQQRVTQVSGCEVALLVTFVPAGEKQSFKAHPLKVVYQQAKALGLQHLVMEVDAAPTYLDSYRANIRRLHEQYGITALATGDILDVCNSFMPRATTGTGVELITPLWGIERPLLLELVWSYVMNPLITCVNTTKFCSIKKVEMPAVQEGGVTQPRGNGAEGAKEELKEEDEGGARAAENGELGANGEVEVMSDTCGGSTAAEGASADVKPSAAGGAHGVAVEVRPSSSGESAAAGHAVAVISDAAGSIPAVAADASSLIAAEAACEAALSSLDSVVAVSEGGMALIGRQLDRQLYETVLKPASVLYGMDECGEWGEYHTMVMDSRLFAAPLRFSFETQKAGDYTYLAFSSESADVE